MECPIVLRNTSNGRKRGIKQCPDWLIEAQRGPPGPKFKALSVFQLLSMRLENLAGSSALRARHISAISSDRWSPSHIDLVPGCPSDLRPKNPPSCATTSCIVRSDGGWAGGGFLVTKNIIACNCASS